MIKLVLVVGVLGLSACGTSVNGGAPTTGGPSSAAASSGGAVKISIVPTEKGKVLFGPTGHALYTYQPDTARSSTCIGKCARNWPPLVGTPDPGAGLSASEFGTITRSDGARQITYNGHPLYYFGKDKAAINMFGDSIAGVWHLAKVDDAGAAH